MKQLALLASTTLAVLAPAITACGGDLVLPDPPARVALRVVDGDGQRGTVGEPLPAFVKVVVQTDAGDPLDGQRVAFMTSGTNPAERFEPDVAVTDANGQAFTRWFLGTAPGPYAAEVRVLGDGDSTVTTDSLHADAIPGDPDTLRATSATSRPGRRGQALDEPLTVVVVDRFGNPVGGADIEWKVSNGDDGTLSAEHTPAALDGTASVTWTLGGRFGVQRAEAKVQQASGSPVTFTAFAF